MQPAIETTLKNLPDLPGVYQFLDTSGKVLYVGKAQNLKNRVRSYFSGTPMQRIANMVKKAASIEIIVTDNEIEALVLENNLIKLHTPRYNVTLKDGKTYPFIKVTREPYPRIFPTRNVVRDGSKYFGPFTDVKSMRGALRMINSIFKIRSCKFHIDESTIRERKHKVCLDYHIKKCDGACEGLVLEAEYRDMVRQAVTLLSGKTDALIKELKERMQSSAKQMQFEIAAELRDKISHLQSISERQKIIGTDTWDRDIIAAAKEVSDAACSVFTIRSGKLIGKKQLRLALSGDEQLETIYASFIKLYYHDFAEIPQEILLECLPEDSEIIGAWLEQQAGYKVHFHVPQRGNLRSLLEMGRQNAELQLKEIQLQRMKKDGDVPHTLAAMKRDLQLPSLPRHIECFDISHIQGADTVASMVVFIDGKPKRSMYRKYIIKTVSGVDDFASMREVVERRFRRLIEEKQAMPDLIMIDGGKGQLSSAVEVLTGLGVKNFQIIGLAKRLEEIFVPGRSESDLLPKTSSSLKLLQQIRDEAHRFAITFHRQKRSKRTIATELTDIDGIGEKVAMKLLKEFGSLDSIRKAEAAALEAAIGKKRAALVLDHFTTEHP